MKYQVEISEIDLKKDLLIFDILQKIHLDVKRMKSEGSRYNFLNTKTKYFRIKKIIG